MKKSSAHLGFTLVELLIVIAVIGILMSGMLLSGSSATSSARALSIVNDLRVMKQAVFLMYLDSMDYFDKEPSKFTDTTPDQALARYVDNPGKYESNRYGFAVSSNGRWYIYYDVGNDASVKTSLSGRAKTDGLLEGTNGGPYKSGEKVYMLAR